MSEKVALVYGSNGSIGTEITRAFAAAGYQAVGTDSDSKKTSEEFARLVKGVEAESGPIEVLVNVLALHDGYVDPVNLPLDDEDALDNEVRATRRLIASVADGMQARGGGVILNVASILGGMNGGNQGRLAAAKASVMGLTRGLALELGRYQIRVVSVSHGLIETPSVRRYLQASSDAERRIAIDERIPLGRVGRPEDVSGVCVFAASDRASFITGSDLMVDGGTSAFNTVFSYNP